MYHRLADETGPPGNPTKTGLFLSTLPPALASKLLESVLVKRLLCFVAFMLGGCQLDAQPTGNILSRVFEVRLANGAQAKAFLVDYEDRQYFVTARHVVESVGEKAAIEMLRIRRQGIEIVSGNRSSGQKSVRRCCGSGAE